MMPLPILVLVHISKCGVATKMVWGKNGTPDTLTSAGTTLSISDLTANKFNQFMSHRIPTGGNFDNDDLYFNGDNTSTVNAYTSSTNNGTTSPTVSADGIIISHGNASWEYFHVCYMVSISGEEKLGIVSTCGGATGAGSTIHRTEIVYKFVPSSLSANVTQVAITEKGSGNHAIDSNLSALGTEGVASLNVQDGAVYYDKQLNKEYVLSNNIWTEL